jgi:hypothetical protein
LQHGDNFIPLSGKKERIPRLFESADVQDRLEFSSNEKKVLNLHNFHGKKGIVRETSPQLEYLLKDSSVRTPYKIRVNVIFVGEQLHGCREIIG